MTAPGFTCPCGRPVEVFRRVGNGPILWHACDEWSGGINGRDEAHLLELWNAERQRRGA